MSRLSREPTDVEIDGFTHGGEGVARLDGKAVFVPGALPGEQVRARVVDDRKRWARAELLEVIAASADRVAPGSVQLHPCGGCDLQHVSPEGQRRLKTRVLREQLERLGRIDGPPVADAIPAGPPMGYRTNARLHADDEGRLGFHLPGTHDVLPLVDGCRALSDAVAAILASVGDDTGAAEVTIRAHPRTGAAAVILTPGPGGLDLPPGDFDLLLEQPDGALAAIRGEGLLSEVVAGHTYRFDARSFFQVNTDGAEVVVEQVLAACGDVDGALVWDLYAGVGLFSLPLAARGAEVVAVEGYPPAAAWAARNAAEAGLAGTGPGTVQAVDQPVDVVTRRSRRGEAGDPPELVVLDPPRSGAGGEVVADLIELAPPVVVYVACDPAALARDAKDLLAGGYRLTSVQPLDLFPLTHHVESVATFTR